MYTPVAPNKYNGKQILLNSGRLLFNAKDDAILLFAKKSVVLSSAGTIDINSDDHFIVGSPKIYLGIEAHKEKEPILLGTTTNNLLKDLLDSLSTFTNLVSTGAGSPQSLMAGAGALEGKVKVLQQVLKNKELLSKQSYVA